MNLIRFIAIALVSFLIYRLVKIWLGKSHTKSQNKAQVGTMVRCAHCGLHIPKQESLCVDEQYYCCKDHRDAEHGH